MKAFKHGSLFLCVGLCVFVGCAAQPRIGQSDRPPSLYTSALPITQAGCSNLYKVSDDLYRGAQPEEKCFPYLEQLGIRTVIDLRLFHSDKKGLEGMSLQYISIPMAPWDPKPEQVRRFLGVITNPDNQPVFLHCRQGADRTGTLIAVYRIVIEGWTKERAIEEMTEGPFGYHEFWSGLPKFLEKLDVEALRQEFHTVQNYP